MLPKYVKRVRSKGKDYYYFDTGKRLDGKKVYARLPDLRDPGFGGSLAAMQGHRNRKAAENVMRVPGLIDLYQRSPDYRALAPSSRKLYDIYLSRFEKLLPTAPVVGIRRPDIQKLVDKMAETPGAANAFLRVLSAVFTWAEKRDYVAKNPCDGIDRFDLGEHQPWPDHILQAALIAEDGRVRLLTHLLYYTAQRISDVVRMGWSDIIDGRVAVVQQKTKNKVRIRLHEGLNAEIAKHTPRATVIYTTIDGRPIKAGSAAKLLTEFTAAAGHRCVPHGLRKNAVIALLEAGCTVAETSSVSGQSLRMVEHYAKERNQVTLGDAAILRWEKNGS